MGPPCLSPGGYLVQNKEEGVFPSRLSLPTKASVSPGQIAHSGRFRGSKDQPRKELAATVTLHLSLTGGSSSKRCYPALLWLRPSEQTLQRNT